MKSDVLNGGDCPHAVQIAAIGVAQRQVGASRSEDGFPKVRERAHDRLGVDRDRLTVGCEARSERHRRGQSEQKRALEHFNRA